MGSEVYPDEAGNTVRLTQRAFDGWKAARFQAICVAWSWFQQSGVPRPAGNTDR